MFKNAKARSAFFAKRRDAQQGSGTPPGNPSPIINETMPKMKLPNPINMSSQIKPIEPIASIKEPSRNKFFKLKNLFKQKKAF